MNAKNLHHKKLRLSLATRITTYLAIGLAVILLLSGWLLNARISARVTAILAQEKENVLMVQAENAALPLWNFDTDQIKTIVESLAGDDAVIYAGILDEGSGKIVHEVKKQESDKATEDHVTLKKPIIYTENNQPKTLGHITITLEYSGISKQVRSTTRDLALVVCGMLAALIAVVYTVANFLVRPVTLLTKRLTDVSQDPSAKIVNNGLAISSDTLEVERLLGAIDLLQTNYGLYQKSLIDAKEAAENSNRTKSEFLANMSHELRTPLNSIIGLTEILKDSRVTVEQTEMLKTIEVSSGNLLEIVNDILDISKIESGLLELEKIPFDAYAALIQITRMLEPQAQKKNLLLEGLNPNAMVIPVKGDPVRFIRVITNLIGNAIKYTEKGKVTVSLRTTSLQENSINLLIDVTDTGIGIAENKLDKIFEKFVQADASTTRKYGGSGLGLAITKQIVELMGGKIGVRSVVGQGSTFWVDIPMTPISELELSEEKTSGAQGTENNTPPAMVIPAQDIRVLVAEDHPLNQVFMKKFLPSLGINNFTIVENGALARDAVRGDDHDLILMDCHMPEMNGYDATGAIRQEESPKGRHIPIIAMTANAMVGEEEKCLRAGMDAYLSKPVSRARFVEVLSRWIRFDLSSIVEKRTSTDSASTTTLDLSNIREISQGDAATERHFADIFMTDTAMQLETLRPLGETSGREPAWKEISHSLKGASTTIGAMHLKDLCLESERLVDADSTARKKMIAAIEAEFEKVKAALKREIP